MGIEEEANRTLFIRNLDQRVTEELLFELFLQAGPLTKTKIPKDQDGKQKTFGFAVYKDEDSVPYALKLLDGTSLFGRTMHVQPRNGSTVNRDTSPGNTPNPHGQWSQGQMNSPPYSPQMQRSSSFGSPDTMQKQVMMSNLMLQIQMTQMQQLQQQNGSLLGPAPQQRQQFGSGGGGGGGGYDGGSRNGGGQRDSDSSWQHSSSQMNTSGSHYSRGQRYADEQGSGGGGGGGRHQQHGHGGGGGYHDNKGGNNYQGNRGSSRHHDDRSDNRSYQDSRRRRY